MIGNDLLNKQIVVFGGSGQIGFELVKFLSSQNINTIVADIDEENFNQKRDQLKNNTIVRFFKCDVLNENNVKKVYLYANDNGGYNGIVNCIHFKGNTQKLDTSSDFFNSFLDYSVESWDLVHNVNLRGSFIINKLGIKLKKTETELSIVNVSSTYGINSPNPSIYGDSGINSPISYASSKSAIINLTKYIAVHSKKYNVRANTLVPGGVYNNQKQSFVKKYSELTVLGRMAKPTDYIGGFIYLLSDSSSYMTGSSLIIDGGWTAW